MIDKAKKAAARAEYERQSAAAEKINLGGIAKKVGINRTTLKYWADTEVWGGAPRQKSGAPIGNSNAKGNRCGAPKGNKNAEKDGAYSTIDFNNLSDSEKFLLENMPADLYTLLQDELKAQHVAEKRLLDRLLALDTEAENTLHLSRQMDMRRPDGTGGTAQSMGMYSYDTAFARALVVGNMLNKVQGRAAMTIKSIIAIEESNRRLELERQRLDIMRNRAMGTVDIEL